ncbi:MAG: hypothetical protein COT00_02110 [Candidatus Omnitrophica bacterium CG07_land_8_20_14_0_80_50_8]|nr:MAG: hypothetical protein COT00_02110 [Candidatus Omnitrophica bacterium CG07_land_8_20_14_0_80_50_8]
MFVGLFGFSKISIAKTYARPAEDPAIDNGSAQTSQEVERTKELLEIWKDHVRTLTKERDAAYRELEALKSQGAGSAEMGDASQEAILKEKEDALRQVEDLKGRLDILQTRYDKLQSTTAQNEEKGKRRKRQ